jgi:hypothetical protein
MKRLRVLFWFVRTLMLNKNITIVTHGESESDYKTITLTDNKYTTTSVLENTIDNLNSEILQEEEIATINSNLQLAQEIANGESMVIEEDKDNY